MTEPAASHVGLRRRRLPTREASPEDLRFLARREDEGPDTQTPLAFPIGRPNRDWTVIQPPGGERNTWRRIETQQRLQEEEEEPTGNHRIPRGNPPPSDHTGGFSAFGVSQVYFVASTLLALIAILWAPTNGNLYATTTAGGPSEASSTSHPLSSKPAAWSSHVELVGKAAAVGLAAKRGGETDPETRDILQSIQQWWNIHSLAFAPPNNNPNHHPTNANKKNHHSEKEWNGPPPSDNLESSTHRWISWLRLHFSPEGRATKKVSSELAEPAASYKEPPSTSEAWTTPEYLWNWIDPTILHPSASTTTDIIDKILTSTSRLLAISNLMLAMTYLLHSAVATWFLGDHQQFGFPTATGSRRGPGGNSANMAAADFSNPARERMGGFLVFKLLLISAVVAPDTLDLLILLTWYTILSCMRSLDHLAHSTTLHLSALGQSPRSGVIHLLFLVLGCNILAAASCVALFHAAGWGMVLLLTCDCALLAADVLSHILKHFTCVMEDIHSQATAAMEGRQLELHNHNQQPPPLLDPSSTIQRNAIDETENIASSLDEIIDGMGRVDPREEVMNGDGANGGEENLSGRPAEIEDDDNHTAGVEGASSTDEIIRESRNLDRQMEVMDLAHARRMGIMDSAMFALELLCHALTVAHFCHIWSLHGVQFTLIDGVLALHLHSAISSACRKIAQRRNIYSIARDLHGLFPNASDQELQKASQAGDVCCICLGTMSTGGHVKKVPCGHLFHTHCLREVVERAQSVHAAKCPLCRASLLDGSRPEVESTTANVRGTTPGTAVAGAPPATNQAPIPPQVQQQQQQPQRAGPNGGAEHALFRFSTEGILPAWMPIPAFSFEVVRRPSGMGPGIPPTGQLGAPLPQPVPNNDLQQQPPSDRNNLADHSTTRVENPTPGAVAPGQQSPSTTDAQTESPPHRIPQDPPAIAAPQPQQAPQSFLQRMLMLAGAIPMSPEEEARALNQLVDMFPQYERLHLQRELRTRGSAEAVAEAILMGVFVSGIPRGGDS